MTLQPFTISYHFNGRDFDLTLHAHDHDDARNRLRSAFCQGREPQQVVAQVSAPGWMGRLMGGADGNS